MNTKLRLTVVNLFCMVFLIAALVGCGQVVTPPTPGTPATATDTPSITATPESTTLTIADIARNEVILTGRQTDVANLASVFSLSLIATIDLGYLVGMGAGDIIFPLPLSNKRTVNSPVSGSPDLVIALYENPDEDISTLLDLVTRLNGEGNPKVYADPNYLTDPLAAESCGEPYSGGGSPYSGGGSPYAGLGLNVNITDLKDQWAFQPPTVVTGGSALGNDVYTGDGAKVAIFDTSPYSGFLGEDVKPLPNGTPVTISDSILQVRTQQANSTTAPASTPPPNQIETVIDHGWFVAGLVNTVAPDSKLFLYRVLDDHGCGDLFTVEHAVHHFLQLMGAELTSGEIVDKVVLSLSLGVHVPDGIYHKIETGQELPEEIASLQTTIHEAFRVGAVIVAAAGNDSAPPSEDSPMPAQKMQPPAYYQTVIGVAAVNQDGERSCFSNEGDVAAPGGDGGVGMDLEGQSRPCAPRTEKATVEPRPCTAEMHMCHYGVVGPSTLSTTKYGLWSGTSFATPIVSGLAALAFELVVGAEKTVIEDQNLIYCVILAAAQHNGQQHDPALGRGQINIGESLSGNIDLSTCSNLLPPAPPQ